MSREHIVGEFDRELSDLNGAIMEMSRGCEKQLARALEALVRWTPRVGEEIAAGEAVVNQLQRKVDQLTVSLLAKRQPMAVDLRTVIAALKMALEYERISDYAVNITRYAKDLSDIPYEGAMAKIKEMGELAIDMLSRVNEAYRERDADKAVASWRLDANIDRTYTSLLGNLGDLMGEHKEHAKGGASVLFVARAWERVGDHLKNVAENIHYVVTGQNYHEETVSHPKG